MNWSSDASMDLNIDGVHLEGRAFGPSPDEAPTILLLHEGLGCVALWRDFPQKLSERTGCGVFAYSRQGYGQSDPISLPRPLNYMNLEAENVVGKVLDAIGAREVILVGHSDGGSIAAIYAGISEDARVKAVAIMAPHFFAEDISVSAITGARESYRTTDLKAKLSKYHAHVDCAFKGWCNSWLDPEFREWNIEGELSGISVPLLFIQGEDDQYGTLAQLEALRAGLNAELQERVYEGCGHSPFQEKPEQVLKDMEDFVRQLNL